MINASTADVLLPSLGLRDCLVAHLHSDIHFISSSSAGFQEHVYVRVILNHPFVVEQPHA